MYGYRFPRADIHDPKMALSFPLFTRSVVSYSASTAGMRGGGSMDFVRGGGDVSPFDGEDITDGKKGNNSLCL